MNNIIDKDINDNDTNNKDTSLSQVYTQTKTKGKAKGIKQSWEAFLKRKEVPVIGRPVAIRSVKELERKMQKYLSLVYEYNNDNTKEITKFPTLEGFALSMGISVHTLYDYAKKDGFSKVIDTFKTLQGEVLLSKIQDKSQFTPGQQFLLKNILKDHYKDKVEVETEVNHTFSLSDLHKGLIQEEQREIIDLDNPS